MLEIIDILLSRRSIRHFTDQPVNQETLVLLLKAAMAVPTACIRNWPTSRMTIDAS